jgi:4-amino-4-deoxy-L-arabinose transferase-like glycosyltransferase
VDWGIAKADRSAVGLRVARRDLVLPRLAVAWFLILKLIYALFVPPNIDEAYYWLWGAHLQWSYLDHAPLVGWASGAAALLLGWTPIALHLPALLSFGVLVWGLARSAEWLAPEDPERHFWVGLALFCASPLLNALTTLNYPDHLLICFSALSMLQLGKYLGALGTGGEGRLRDLYLGALFMGLAGLSKYNAVFIALGLLVVIVGQPAFRRLLRSPHLYLAGLLTVAITLPVVWWNAQHHFVSLGFHTARRFNASGSHFALDGVTSVLTASLFYVSPFLAWGLLRFLFGRVLAGPQGAYQLLGRWTALLSSVGMLALASWSAAADQVKPHWLVLSFLPFVIVAPLFVRSRWAIRLHLAWGILLMSVAALYYLAAPLPTQWLGMRDREAVETFGQEQAAAAARVAAKQYGAQLIAASTYGNTAKLAFGLGTDSNLIDLGGEPGQFQLWREGQTDAGKDVIIVAPAGSSPSSFAARFDHVEDLGPIETERYGQQLATYRLLLGRGLRP